MRTVQGVLSVPQLRGALTSLASPTVDRSVSVVSLVESLASLATGHQGEIAILSNKASEAAHGYALDVALREASSAGVALLLLTGLSDPALHRSAREISETYGPAVFAADPSVELVPLINQLNGYITGDAQESLSLCAHVLQQLRGIEEDVAPEKAEGEILSLLREAIGPSLRIGDLSAPATDSTSPRRVTLQTDESSPSDATLIVLELGSTAIVRARDSLDHLLELPARSEAELLTQILQGSDATTGPLLQRARAIGLVVDGWHIAIRIELSNLGELAGQDEIAAIEMGRRMEQIAHTAAVQNPGSWHRTRTGSSITLIRMQRADPGLAAQRETVVAANKIVHAMRGREPRLRAFIGISSVLAGSTGMRSAVAEASAAAATARLAGRINEPQSFDSVGLRRTLVEWYSTDTAREAVGQMLAPLIELGGDRADTAIRTLGSYLDNQGSLKATANDLHLHRNAVAYRIKSISERLGSDLMEAEERILLQLACRAYFLS